MSASRFLPSSSSPIRSIKTVVKQRLPRSRALSLVTICVFSSKGQGWLLACFYIVTLYWPALSNMPTKVRSLVVISILVAFAHAYTTFQPNCTAPSTSVNFVSSNETRGTIDILWSCLFTIIACTWTVQHLNVPEQREDQDKGWLGDIKWALKRTLRSAKWMLLTAVAPEALIMKSLGDRVAIHSNFERLSQLATEDGVPWSRTHSLFANMGGFVIRGNVPDRVGHLDDNKADPAPSNEVKSPETLSNYQEPDATQHSRSGNRQIKLPAKDERLNDVEVQSSKPSSNYSNPYHLLTQDLVTLKEAGFLARLPFITVAELNDKSKTDSLVRVLAVVQILWMVSQVIVRATRHLAISQLEIAVVAFAVCAVVIYCANWEKPKDVQTPYTVLQYRGPIPQAVLNRIGKGREDNGSLLKMFFDIVTEVAVEPDRQRAPHGTPIPNHFIADPLDVNDGGAVIAELAGLVLGGVVFGAIHVAAWHFVFPTLVERIIWRAASIVCTAGPLVLPLNLGLGVLIPGNSGTEFSVYKMLEHIWEKSCILIQILYVVSRIFLLVEIFRTLCFLPPTAYVATWATNVPHVA